MDEQDYMQDMEANFKQLLAEAPATRCGRCRAVMTAERVTLTVSVDFHWHDWRAKKKSQEFLSAFTGWADPMRYDGDVEYHCAQCGNLLHHKQQVWLDEHGYHFKPPQESSQSS